jgi:hypothetical protein
VMHKMYSEYEEGLIGLEVWPFGPGANWPLTDVHTRNLIWGGGTKG